MAMQSRCSCIPVFSGFPGAHWISPVCPKVAFAGKLCVHLRGTATMNKVKRWREDSGYQLWTSTGMYMQTYTFKQNTYYTQTQTKKLLYLIFNADMDSRTIRVSGFPGSPHYMDEFT